MSKWHFLDEKPPARLRRPRPAAGFLLFEWDAQAQEASQAPSQAPAQAQPGPKWPLLVDACTVSAQRLQVTRLFWPKRPCYLGHLGRARPWLGPGLAQARIWGSFWAISKVYALELLKWPFWARIWAKFGQPLPRGASLFFRNWLGKGSRVVFAGGKGVRASDWPGLGSLRSGTRPGWAWLATSWLGSAWPGPIRIIKSRPLAAAGVV